MTGITFGQVLQIAPSSDVLTDPVKGHLCGTWGETDATEIGGKHIVTLATSWRRFCLSTVRGPVFCDCRSDWAPLAQLDLPQAPTEPQIVRRRRQAPQAHVARGPEAARMQPIPTAQYIDVNEELAFASTPGSSRRRWRRRSPTLQYAAWLGRPGSSQRRRGASTDDAEGRSRSTTVYSPAVAPSVAGLDS
jgi:hypothetical protein